MPKLLSINVDVPDLIEGQRFYEKGLGLTYVGTPEEGICQLSMGEASLYLLEKQANSRFAQGTATRDYSRHWTPVHIDIEVPNLQRAVDRALEYGARLEGQEADKMWGNIATLSDPFGNGFCLVEAR